MKYQFEFLKKSSIFIEKRLEFPLLYQIEMLFGI